LRYDESGKRQTLTIQKGELWMITTVTMTTVALITPLTATSLGLIGVGLLLLLLVKKELLASSTDARAQRLRGVLAVAIMPLVLGFALSAVVKLAEVLQ
jgi:hypothetical protein